MVNSIRQFIEKETYEIEKTMKKFVEGEIDIDFYGKKLQERSLRLTKDILIETLELMDQAMKDSLQRKEAYVVEQCRQPRSCSCPWGASVATGPAIPRKDREIYATLSSDEFDTNRYKLDTNKNIIY